GAFVVTGFAGVVLRFFIIFNSDWGKDEPQTLRYAITPNCSMGADGGQHRSDLACTKNAQFLRAIDKLNITCLRELQIPGQVDHFPLGFRQVRDPCLQFNKTALQRLPWMPPTKRSMPASCRKPLRSMRRSTRLWALMQGLRRPPRPLRLRRRVRCHRSKLIGQG
ncbi:MAG: hypothetical protein RLZZ141_1771, partial [Pseudomonadota bacterium]